MTSSPPASFSLRARGPVAELSSGAASSGGCLVGRGASSGAASSDVVGLVELLQALDLGTGGVRICRLLLGGVGSRCVRRALRRRGLARLARSALGGLFPRRGLLALGLLRLFGHQAITSICSGFCAAWG